jgi:iron(III) transport system ATP-binding protein
VSELRVNGLHKSFGPTPVLRGVDLHVRNGTLTAVLGPSGCGKTTLLRCIAGFERPDDGSIQIAGRPVAGPRVNTPPERRRIGVVPQEGTLFPHLSVGENVGFGLPRRTPGRAARISELLGLVGLGGLEKRRPHELSGGQQQRVALARALLPGPAVVLLDEPFSALDAGLRAAVRDDVREILHEVGATAVLVTHDQEEALSVADEVAVMREGVVVQHGTPRDIYLDPVDLEVARFVGDAVVMEAEAADGVVVTALGRLDVKGGRPTPGTTGRVVIRPEQIQLVSPGDGVPARVVRTVFHGHDSTVELATPEGPGLPPRLLCRVQGAPPSSEDVAIRVAEPVCWFPAS